MVVKPFHGQRLLVVLVLVSIGIEHMFQKFHSMNQVICVNTFLDRNFLSRQRNCEMFPLLEILLVLLSD
ncbi:hypothetical protein CMV_025312 [Castanea mollissima]|uniref:Secreted protein n=1 Tax=Castanea mollissima TaxID=60419 RepID=A0A8J4QGB0_9ROSI|nr:hypothetical protein CMV_025312 [Castanea mollissima]